MAIAIKPAQVKNQLADASMIACSGKSLYKIASVAALLALAANLLDVILGFGETDLAGYGAKTAIDWFALFQADGFKGLYVLGLLNIIYQTAMIPVYFALFAAHRRTHAVYAALAMVVAFIGMAIYLANNAAIPMYVLSIKYAAAGTDAQRALLAAAGEAVLARGEDFTPGAFIGLFGGSSAAIGISLVMLRGGVFGKTTAWIGLLGFTLLSIFTIWATFIPVLYTIAFYVFGMSGGLFALAWFALIARTFFKLGQTRK